LSAKKGVLGGIAVDHIGLMVSNDDNAMNEISKISRKLKQLSMELNCPVFLVSQLNRGVEGRNDKRPMMSDLRASGSIEQDSDIVIMLYRDEYYNPDSPNKGIAEVLIRKHRAGETGTVKLIFDGATTKFKNYAGY
jgi:replicative DNA helicase